MKYLNTILLLIAIAVLGYNALQPKSQTAAPVKTAYDRVMETRTLRCGYAVSPPLFVKDANSGKVSGLDVDVMEEVSKQLGIKIEWTEEAGWGNFIEGLRAGRYDAFCSQLWPEQSRSKFLSLAGPVLYSFTETYVRADDFRFDGSLGKINDPSITIPVIDGDISVQMANRYPQAKQLALPQTATVSDMLESVLTKKADILFFEQAMVAAFPAEQRAKLRRVEGVGNSFTFGGYYGLKAGETVLRDMISLALRTMIDDGRLRAIAMRYSADYTVPSTGYTKGN